MSNVRFFWETDDCPLGNGTCAWRRINPTAICEVGVAKGVGDAGFPRCWGRKMCVSIPPPFGSQDSKVASPFERRALFTIESVKCREAWVADCEDRRDPMSVRKDIFMACY